MLLLIKALNTIFVDLGFFKVSKLHHLKPNWAVFNSNMGYMCITYIYDLYLNLCKLFTIFFLKYSVFVKILYLDLFTNIVQIVRASTMKMAAYMPFEYIAIFLLVINT